MQRLFRLIRFRNTYPAFAGEFSVLESPEHTLWLMWQRGDAVCTLHVDLIAQTACILCRDEHGDWVNVVI